MSRIFKKIIKNTFIISLGTLISRILGFFRDILIANFFGTSFLIEAFLVAFRIPNIFRSLLGEGAVDSVVIPVISEYKEKDFTRVCSHLISTCCFLLSIVVVLGIVFAKYIVILTAPGFLLSPEKFELTVRLTRIVFSYLLFIGLSANLGGILYTKGNFFVPSFSPLLLNLTVILGICLLSIFKEEPIYTLSYFVILAGLLQFLWNFLASRRYFNLTFNIKEALLDKATLKMGKLSLPRIWSVAIYHINVFLDTFLASFSNIVGEGAVAGIYYSNRLIQFPLALFSLSISRAVLPGLSNLSAEEKFEEFNSTLSFSLKNLSFFMIPFSLFFLFFSSPLIEVIFKRGVFDSYSVNITSSALFFYSLGLFFFSSSRLLISAFYSLKDTKTPAKISTFVLLINFILSIILMRPLKIGGLALASSISSTVGFLFLLKVLEKRIGIIKGLGSTLLKLTGISIISVGIGKVYFILSEFALLPKIVLTLGIIMVSFFILCFLGKIEPLPRIGRWIFGKK